MAFSEYTIFKVDICFEHLNVLFWKDHKTQKNHPYLLTFGGGEGVKKYGIFFQILWPFQKTFTLLYLHTSIRSDSLIIRSYENLRVIDIKSALVTQFNLTYKKVKKKCRVGVSYRQCTWWFYSCKYIFVCTTYIHISHSWLFIVSILHDHIWLLYVI